MFVLTDDMPLERLEHEITSLAGQVAATECRWLQLVAEFDRREGWATWGMRSCAHWLSWRCGMSLNTGREHVRVGHALRQLPRTTAAFERGELSYSKVRAITRIAAPSTEVDIVEFAKTATASQLDRSVRAFIASNGPPTQPREEQHLRVTGDGSIRGQAPAEVATVINAALEAALALVPVDDASAGARSIEQRRVDALLLMAESFLANGAATRQGDERAMVVVHVDADEPASPELDNGVQLHPETASRLGCDASVIAVIEREGIPVGAGRRTRSIPRRVRRAVRARDRHCRWPGCNARLFTEIHHRQHWTNGGGHAIDNLVVLCWFHHHLVHEGGFSIDRDHRVFRPDGVEVVAPPADPTEPLAPVVDATAIVSRWAGERFDLDLTLTAMHTLVDRDVGFR